MSAVDVLAVMRSCAEQLGMHYEPEADANLEYARTAVSDILDAAALLADVYDAMGAPRGPARIKLDAALARCKGEGA